MGFTVEFDSQIGWLLSGPKVIRECKAKALFYKGRCFSNKGNLEGATLPRKGNLMIPDLTVYYLVGLIYSYLGHLNRDEEHYKKALLLL